MNKLDEYLEHMKDVYINMVKNATQEYYWEDDKPENKQDEKLQLEDKEIKEK